MAKDTRLHIRIDEELKGQVEKLAQQENRTISNYVLTILQKEVNKKEVAKMKVNLFLSNEDVEVIENSKHIDEGTGMEAYFTEDDRIVAFDEAANGWVQLGRKVK